MERKKAWKDFQTLEKALPDYRRWTYCEDPEEKALWKELLDWENRLSDCAALIRRTPMPTEINDIVRTRASLHISQRIVFHHFLELLFENCLRKNDDENLNLLFAFLEDYSNLLEKEAEWCGT